MLIFRNPGLIDLDAVRTMGVSVKRPGSFGFFGTGLKFALATVLRGGGKLTIYRGFEAYEVSSVEREIRGETFSLVTLDGETMGITTQLGRNWEPWMVLRELGCNARDEGGTFGTHEDMDADRLADDVTTIVVEWDALDAAYKQRSTLFVEGEPLFENEQIRILPGTSAHVFYRGVRAHKLAKPSIYTYDLLSEQMLTEDRTILSTWNIDQYVRNALLQIEDGNVIRPAITTGDGYMEASIDFAGGGKASRAFLDSAIEAREARQSLNTSAKKVLLKHIREAAASEQVSGGYTRFRNDAFAYALDQLSQVGIKFDEEQQFITVDELPGEAKTTFENRRIYILHSLLRENAQVIAEQLLARWVDLNVNGYDQESVTRLLAPVIINACPQFQVAARLIAEDETGVEPEEVVAEDFDARQVQPQDEVIF